MSQLLRPVLRPRNITALTSKRTNRSTYTRFLQTMASTQSQACCNTPAIVGKGYNEKGSYITVDGMKTYATGPSSATRGILVVFDIFGFFPQTLQGADILAHSDSEKQYQVFMPDFFEGKPADISWYPPQTDEQKEKLGAFFQNQAAPDKTVPRVPKVIKEIQSKHPEIKEWGVVGYCWGGKIVNLVSQNGTPFKSAAVAHPAMVDAKDAPNLTIPILVIPSSGEDKNDVAAYEKELKVKHEVDHRFEAEIHGFMAARSNLEDPKQAAAYEKGYQKLLSWFHETM